jgi:hypothetical protein
MPVPAAVSPVSETPATAKSASDGAVAGAAPAPPEPVLTLALGDFLPCIPRNLLRGGEQNPETPVTLTVTELARCIVDGRATAGLRELFRDRPEMFVDGTLPPADQEIRYPWRKILALLQESLATDGIGTQVAIAVQELRAAKSKERQSASHAADTNMMSKAAAPAAGPKARSIVKGRGGNGGGASWFTAQATRGRGGEIASIPSAKSVLPQAGAVGGATPAPQPPGAPKSEPANLSDAPERTAESAGSDDVAAAGDSGSEGGTGSLTLLKPDLVLLPVPAAVPASPAASPAGHQKPLEEKPELVLLEQPAPAAAPAPVVPLGQPEQAGAGAAESDHQKALAERDRREAELRGGRERLLREKEAAAAAHELKISGLAAAHAAALGELRRSMEAARDEMESQLRDEYERQGSAISAEQRARDQAALVTLEARWLAEREETAAAHARALDEANAARAAAVAALEAQLAASQGEFAAQLASSRSEAEAQLESSRSNFETAIANARNEAERQLSELRAAFAAERQSPPTDRDDLAAEVQSLSSTLADKEEHLAWKTRAVEELEGDVETYRGRIKLLLRQRDEISRERDGLAATAAKVAALELENRRLKEALKSPELCAAAQL